MRLLLSIAIFLFTTPLMGQGMEITLLDPVSMTGNSHITEPIIFHFEGVNPGLETILVDITKSNASHPMDWDVSICTTSCLPPETDETTFPIGAMLDESFSIYFFPRSPGLGQVDVSLVSQDDSTDTYTTTLYLSASEPTGLSEPEIDLVHSLRVKADRIEFQLMDAALVQITDMKGTMVYRSELEKGKQHVSLSNWKTGTYALMTTNKAGRMSLQRFYLE